MKYDVALVDGSIEDLMVLLFENSRRDGRTAAELMKEHLEPGSKIRQILLNGARHANKLREEAGKATQEVPDFLGMSPMELLGHLQHSDYPEGLALFETMTVPRSSVIRV